MIVYLYCYTDIMILDKQDITMKDTRYGPTSTQSIFGISYLSNNSLNQIWFFHKNKFGGIFIDALKKQNEKIKSNLNFT